jgi:hypothetical protein
MERASPPRQLAGRSWFFGTSKTLGYFTDKKHSVPGAASGEIGVVPIPTPRRVEAVLIQRLLQP